MKATTSAIITAIALALAWLTASPTAHAQEGPIDFLSQFDIRLDGEAAFDSVGQHVDGGGDVNDDGTPDVLAVSNRADHNTRQDSGSVYVVFGDPALGTVDLGSLGSNGFRIDGPAAFSQLGDSISMAGDFNNDGLEDVIVGERLADNNSRTNSGSVYVVFGKDTTTNVDLASLGSAGIRIDGAEASDFAGGAVADAGDVNDDGIDDVIVGAAGVNRNPQIDNGAAYVVFGTETPSNVDLASLGASGFRILGDDSAEGAGVSVATAGDANDDGIDDVTLGSPGADNNSRSGSGSVYVVFGNATPANIDTRTLGTAGYRIDGPTEFEAIGVDLDGGGDINTDGRDDIVISHAAADNDNGADAGAAFVVFGKTSTSTLDLASLGSNGFRIDGASADDRAGTAVAIGMDVDHDGRDDVVVGAPQADPNARENSGSAFIVFGRTSTTSVDLAALGTKGFRMDGAVAGDGAGGAVAPAGDIDDDGLADVVVGANGADKPNLSLTGSEYVELVADWLPGACANPRSGTDGDDTLIGGDAGDDITGGDGVDTLQGEKGDDCIEGQDGADDIFGGPDDDTLTGGDQADTAEGEGGKDTLKGGAGGDTLKGGDQVDTAQASIGDDTVKGGAGGDTLEGEDGKDGLQGGDGDDTLKGQKAIDTLEGQADADTLDGGKGDDTLKGGDAKDTLKGGEDEDLLIGGDGNDTLKGEEGKDTIDAGAGDDTIKAEDGRSDTIKCGSGHDDIDADPFDVLKGC